MKYLPLDPAIFIQNRKRFVKEMLPNSIAAGDSSAAKPQAMKRPAVKADQ